MTSRSILVVDDETPLRDMLVLLLQQTGYTVTGAGDGREAAALLKARPFDLVITDLIMPERDGLEFIAEIRQKHLAVRIIAMTGGGHIPQGQYLKIAKSLGAHTVLEKPFSNEVLLAAVEAALAG